MVDRNERQKAKIYIVFFFFLVFNWPWEKRVTNGVSGKASRETIKGPTQKSRKKYNKRGDQESCGVTAKELRGLLWIESQICTIQASEIWHLGKQTTKN